MCSTNDATASASAPALGDLGGASPSPAAAGRSKRRARSSRRASAVLGLVDGGRGDLDGRAVVGPQHQQAVGAGVGTREQVGERGEVPERLRHLLALDHDPAVVDPVAGEGAAQPDGLGALVLVMGEGEVDAPAVQVEVRRPADRATSPRIRCASPDGPAPTASPRWARPGGPSSTARSPEASASPRRARRAPRSAASRGSGGPAARSRRPGRPRGRRRRWSRRRRRGRRGRRSGATMSATKAVACGVSVGRLTPEGVHGLPPHRLVLGGDLGLAAALLRRPW